MTGVGNCQTCNLATPNHFSTVTASTSGELPIGWFCNVGCRLKKAVEFDPTVETKIGEEFTLADEITLEKLISDGQIKKILGEEGVFYEIARRTQDKQEALQFYDRFIKMDRFDRMMQLSFTEGIKNGIVTYRRELSKLGTWTGKKAVTIGDQILAYIERQQQ